jgi:hypothetical protein
MRIEVDVFCEAKLERTQRVRTPKPLENFMAAPGPSFSALTETP